MQKEYLRAVFFIVFCFSAVCATGSEKRSEASFAAEISSPQVLHISIDPCCPKASAIMDVFSEPVKIGKQFVTLHHQFRNISCPGIPPIALGSSNVIASSLFKYCHKLLIYPFHGFW